MGVKVIYRDNASYGGYGTRPQLGWICSVSADGTGFPQSKSIDIRLSLENGHV
jgi:hypothetical protein